MKYFQKKNYWKRKNAIDYIDNFHISHKSYIKTFLKWFINKYPKGTC